MEVGDSPVLSLCLVRRKVWMGMDMGCLLVYDANTRKPYLQVRWIFLYTPCIVLSTLVISLLFL